ncbi:MAB_1171c family putative transporter [Nocardia sp. GCM10030253]|uniref:MAB_1171c family putative transporter n=1 Tax=Nocardia sp. GCM10030253 TaxID=3273404 RepID=UPI0036355E0C
MITPAPLMLEVLVIAFVCAVTVGRWCLVNDSAADKLINRALGWSCLSVLFVTGGAGSEFADLAQRLFLVCGVLSLSSVYGLAGLFTRPDSGSALRRQRRYDLSAVVAGGLLMWTGLPVEPGFGWKSCVVWMIFNLPLALAGLGVIQASLREIRAENASMRARFAFSALMVAAAFWVYAPIADGIQVLGGGLSNSPGQHWTLMSCLTLSLVTSLTAVPMGNALLTRTGWDRTGRDLRRLLPLWRDLTAAVPEIVLPPRTGHSRDPDSRLYRTIVEIRDALLQLQQYVPPDGAADRHVENYAVRIARAAQDKRQGAVPVMAAKGLDRRESVDRDMAGELSHLLDVARVWPRARARALAEPR